MAQCAGITRSGGRCKAGVGPGEQWCYNHDPARAAERKRAASRAGKSKPNRELQEIKARLRELADDVLDGSVDRGDAAVAGQLLNTVIRAVGVELKVKEQTDLIERLEELERLMEDQPKQGRRGYGA
jgi:hypothetical protein